MIDSIRHLRKIPAVPRFLPRAVWLAVPFLAITGCDRSPTDPVDVVPTECVDHHLLAPGQTVRFDSIHATLICVDAGGPDRAEFVLAVHSVSPDWADTINLRVRSDEFIRLPVEDAPVAAALATEALPPPTADELERDEEAHLRLRTMEHELVARLGGAGHLAAPTAASFALPEVGNYLAFNAQSATPCEDPIPRTGRVMAVSERAIVVADTLNPSGGFTETEYARFAADFDTLVAPLAEQAFGSGADVSGLGRTVLFFTQEVNQLSSGPSSVVLGFFFARDLFPKEATPGFQACEHSNETEMLYLLVPDPNGDVGPRRRKDDVASRTLATLIHEYQHLLNAARRLHVLRLGQLEHTWLNEGLSHIAEELLFYRASGLGPGLDIDAPDLLADDQARAAFELHQGNNALRFREYLEAPALNSPYDSVSRLATRGATWNFLRYALDRHGDAGFDLLRDLVDGPGRGIPNLAGAVGGTDTFHEWMADWSLSLYADAHVPTAAPRFLDASWNHRSVLDALRSSQGYPLNTRPLAPDGSIQQRVMGGGTAYLRFGLNGGTEGSVELTRNGNPAPGQVRVTLMRVR